MKRFLQIAFMLSLAFTMQAQVFSEDFEGGEPSGWFAESGWQFGTAASLSSQYYTIPTTGNVYAANDDALGGAGSATGRLVTSKIDLSGVDPETSLILSFDGFFVNGDWEAADETAGVVASSDGIVFNTIGEIVDGAAQTNEFEAMTRYQFTLEGYAGGDLYVGFDYSDGGGWNYGFAIDNVQILELTTARDIAVNQVFGNRYVDAGASPAVVAAIENKGYETVESMMVRVTDPAGSSSDVEVTGLNIPFGAEENVDLQLGGDISTPQTYAYSFEVISVNGEEDENPMDNAGAAEFVSVADVPSKKLIAEEGTGTWCGWCPRGTVFMEQMEADFPDEFIGIAVHNNDVMANTDYDAGVGAFPGFTGYPGVIADRFLVIDPSQLPDYYNLINRISPFSLTMDQSYDPSTREMAISVNTRAHSTFDGNFRMAMVITEDNVTGTSSEYAQTNYYAGGANGQMGGYENLPDPVPAADMVYNHVAREIIGGWNGVGGSVPTSVTNAESYSYDFNYTLPEAYDHFNTNVIILLLDNDSGEVVYGTKEHLNVVSSTDNTPSEIDNVSVYPNPSSDVIYLDVNLNETADVTLAVSNTFGQVVSQRTYQSLNGNMVLPVERNTLPAGQYLATLSVNGKVITKRIAFVD